ncbi:hypothetical protein TNCT_106571 [Trichonephila clavata]|uniref:Uncharacterized protein n=1 Tax=Trichonephila clavata TaxID=2740835 RepID=A0A8X6KLP2_TRICU|nr:hypothetical protein TNCT_106571 [Trichonephila clavata]
MTNSDFSVDVAAIQRASDCLSSTNAALLWRLAKYRLTWHRCNQMERYCKTSYRAVRLDVRRSDRKRSGFLPLWKSWGFYFGNGDYDK